MLKDDSPFYLAIRTSAQPSENEWYKCNSLGINKLSVIMKDMATAAELVGRKTNHSSRKTTSTRLCQAGLADSNVIQRTGHKDERSLKSYSSISVAQNREQSDILLKNASSAPENSHTAVVPAEDVRVEGI